MTRSTTSRGNRNKVPITGSDLATKKSSPVRRERPANKRKKASPVSKAVANTKSIFHYFSPSPPKKEQKSLKDKPPKSTDKISAVGRSPLKKQEEAEVRCENINSTLADKKSGSPVKRKNPSALKNLHPNLMIEKEETETAKKKLKLAAVASLRTTTNTNTVELRPRVHSSNETGVGEEKVLPRNNSNNHTNAMNSNSPVDHNIKPGKSSGIDLNDSTKSPGANATNNNSTMAFTKQIKEITELRSKKSSQPISTNIEPSIQLSLLDKNMKMAFIRVESSATNLGELCQNLCISTTEPEKQGERDTTSHPRLFHLRSNAVLGRSEPKFKKNKIPLGIPKCESGISREHILIRSFVPPSNPNFRICGVDSTSSNEQLRLYLKEAQEKSPTVSVYNKGNNTLLVCKARIITNTEGESVLKGHLSRLDTKCTIILKVGDALVFDAYNYTKEEPSDMEAIRTSKCRYVYRLVYVVTPGMKNVTGAMDKIKKSGEILPANIPNIHIQPENEKKIKVIEKDILESPVAGKGTTEGASSSNLERKSVQPIIEVDINSKEKKVQNVLLAVNSEATSNVYTKVQKHDKEVKCEVTPSVNRRSTRTLRSHRVHACPSTEADEPTPISTETFPKMSTSYDFDNDELSPALNTPANPFTVLFDDCPTVNDDDRMDLDLSQDSFLDFSFHEESTKLKGAPISEMNPSLANSCWRSLNSAEVHNGYGILSHVESSWNNIPSDNLAESFSHFLIHGPKFEGTKFREPFRTELCFSFIEKIMSKLIRNGRKNLVGLQMENDLEQLLAMSVDEMEPDSGDKTTAQIYRMSQALQFCSKSLNFVAKSITMELQDIISEKISPFPRMLDEMQFASLISKGDLRTNLKMVTRNAMKSLIYHVAPLSVESENLCKNVHEQNGAKGNQSCTAAFGVILSHVAWLFCAKENIPFADQSCCYVINDIVNAELAIMNSSSSSRNKLSRKKREKIERDIKIRLLFSLDTNFSLQLQVKIASLMNLSKEAMLVLIN